ncbi:unnamed protein product [Ophioblennius macclurei]
MASKKKQKRMVLQHDRTTTHVADLSPAGGQARPFKAKEGGMERGLQVTGQESESRATMSPSKEAICRPGGKLKHIVSQADNLSADITANGIRVTLDNNIMWNEFYRCKTEMILTKQGSRMFPYCRFRISGLKPSQRYSLIMDIQPVDNSQYKWTGKSWQAAGKAEVHIKSEPFTHPESPAMGHYWMQNPVSFFRLKLTNDLSDQEGNTILRPMHRYLPRLHVMTTDKAAKDLHGSGVVTFTFPQTEFMAVSAYQNTQFAQLKVDCNPFSKGLKEDVSKSLGLKLKANSNRESNKDGLSSDAEQHPIKKSLKSLLANHKPKSAKALDSKLLPPEDLQRQTVTSRDQSAPWVPGECSGGISHPGQKLFSELMRDAHVSLHRCDSDQPSINDDSPLQAEQSSTQTTSVGDGEPGVVQKESMSTKTLAKTDGNIAPTIKSTEEKCDMNVLDCKDSVRTNSLCPAASTSVQNSSKDLDHKSNADVSPEAMARQHKRPPRLPLPALALFLKQHSTKSKKSKPESSPSVLPSKQERLASPPGSVCLPRDLTNAAIDPPNDVKGETSDSDLLVSGESCKGVHSDQGGMNPTLLTDETGPGPSCLCPASDSVQLKTDGDLVSVPDRLDLEPRLSESTVLPESDPPGCTQRCATETSSTSSVFPMLSPPCNSVLLDPNSVQTVTRSSTLHTDSGSPKPDSLLPDPGCSSFGFDTLSPASSPDHLPSLPDSLDFQLDSTVSEVSQTVEPEKDSMQDRASSVFQWHTVLPPPQTYLDPSFTAFQSTETDPLMSTSPPLLPSSTPPHPEPENLSTPMLPPGPPPPFQETEQSLPFPSELSPLALHLSLSPSPSFSPLDGEGLSPTPSLTDLVHFFSVDDLGMEFSNAEVAAAPGPSLPAVASQEPLQGLESAPASKTCRRKKKSLRRKLAKTDSELVADEAAYQSMQPNLEEVEEQLFVSFTSKEALKLHVVETPVEPVPQTEPENQESEQEDQQNAEEPEKSDSESLHEPMVQFQEDLLRDLKLMKHRQVIHPVLQEVGLKMSLLDPVLAIDLQYLGVRLPLPPPGAQLEVASQELPSSEAAFVSRTGKTTDVTQIKGWREKFSSNEAPPTTCTPEVGPSSEPQKKKNLSAFCSDMLDEYLENEGRLIDERAASFSQPPAEQPVYQLPTQSSSYVRTLDHILKKKDAPNPAADLISGFIPPSKRPRPPEARLGKRKPRTFKPKPRGESGPEGPERGTAGLEPEPAKPASQTAITSETELPKKRRRFKPRTTTPPPGMEDLAPLESDSELGPDLRQTEDSVKKAGRPLMARAVLKQKDLEEAVMYEGRPRNSITEERANVALTSLFTLRGFVREDPLAPVQVKRRPRARCLNDFCRLGCVCSSLFTSRRSQHCGRPACMFRCSCLKQKVVLLKNLDGSDCGPASNPSGKKRRRRMKMAYVLKETDSVSHPAERVTTLWWRGASEDPDPDPVYIPRESSKPSFGHRTTKSAKSTESSSTVVRRFPRSCARVRVYCRKDKIKVAKDTEPQPEGVMKDMQTMETPTPLTTTTTMPCNSPLSREDVEGVIKATKAEQPEFVKKKKKQQKEIPSCSRTMPRDSQLSREDVTEATKDTKPGCMKKKKKQLKETPTSPATTSSSQTPAEDVPKPSKRLFIVANCRWGSGERSYVLKKLCEAMAKDQLEKPFWIKNYLIRPSAITVDGGADPCTHYKVHISRPMDDEKDQQTCAGAPPAGRPGDPEIQGGKSPEQDDETVEDWQRAVEEADLEEGQEDKEKEEVLRRKTGWTQEMVGELGLPFLTGISPAGLLTANRKKPGGSNQLVKVNGKLYPLAKIQLGMMGALHPANRLAAYLTGRVGPSRRLQAPSSSSSSPSPSSFSNPQSCSGQTTPAPSSGTSSPVVLAPSLLPTSFAPSLPPQEPAPNAPQVLKIQVPGPGSPWFLPPPPASQKLLVQQIPSNPEPKLYRRQDGKLVQVLVNKVTPYTPNTVIQRVPAAPQPPVVTFLNINSQLTPVKPVYTSVLTSAGTQSLKGNPTPSVINPPSNPSSSDLPLTPPPLPVDFSLASVAGQGAEPRVASVISAPTETRRPPSPPRPAESAHNLEPGQVADMQELVAMETPQAEVELAQSSETDDSFESHGKMEEDSEDSEEVQEEMSKYVRVAHNLLERKRRRHLFKLFERLRHCVGLMSPGTSKMTTLRKSVQEIEQLEKAEKELLEEKRKLVRAQERLRALLPDEQVDEPIVISSDEERRIAESRHKRLKKPHHRRAGGGASPLPAEDGVAKSSGSDPLSDEEKHNATNQHPAGGGASKPILQAPPPPASTPPSHTVVQHPSCLVAPHSSLDPRVRQRTVPNILSRSKRSVPRPTGEGEPTSFLVPANVLSSLQSMFPGQKVVALGPPMSAPAVLQSTQGEGVTSVTLNLQDLTNQELCLAALPHLQTATNISTLLPQQQPPPAPPALPAPLAPPAALVEASDWTSSVSRPSIHQPAEHLSENTTGVPQEVSGVPASVPQPVIGAPQGVGGVSQGPDGESLTSLLNELVFLNQQNVAVATPADRGSAVGGANEPGNATKHDVDSDGTSVTEMDRPGLSKHSNLANTKAGVLAPPPLLQMKVGGANISESSSCDEEGGRREGGVAWRPMPRLVPLGLRGNPAP